MLIWNIVKGTAKLPPLCLCWPRHLYKRHCPSEHNSKQKKHMRLTEQLRREKKLFVTRNKPIATRWHTNLLAALHCAVPKTSVNSELQEWYLAMHFLTKQFWVTNVEVGLVFLNYIAPRKASNYKTRQKRNCHFPTSAGSKAGSNISFDPCAIMPANLLSLPPCPDFLYTFQIM